MFNRLSVNLWAVLPLTTESINWQQQVIQDPWVQKQSRQQPAHSLQRQANTQVCSCLLCFTLNHHCLKGARSMCGCGVPSMTSCTFSTLAAGCSSSPAALSKAHTQPTYPTHSSEFQSGQGLKFTAAKTTPFLGLLSVEDKKGTEEGPLQGRRLCVFPPQVFTYF